MIGSAQAQGRNGLRFRRGAALLPMAFTTGNLFFGFWAIIQGLHGHFEMAALMIFGAMGLDILDGRIARLTGTCSEFGAELDSLADAISFGMAPALLVYTWGFTPVAPAGWLAAFLFLMSGALRLARFNVQRHVADKRYFVGLPIPGAAGQIAVLMYCFPQPLIDREWSLSVVALTVAMAFLMVSTLRYPSFKSIDLRRRRSYGSVLGIALIFLLLASPTHPWVLLVGMSCYTLSGPSIYGYGFLRRHLSHRPEVVPSHTT